MNVRDYNGTGRWSAEAVHARYEKYRQESGQLERCDLSPREHREGERLWIYPVLDNVIQGIRLGDRACVELGVEFLESAEKQPFGRILHANVARALRRARLSKGQVERIRKRVLSMLVQGQVPHEYHEYAKLLRRVGYGTQWAIVRQQVDEANRYVMRYVHYFERFGSPEGAVEQSDAADAERGV